MMGGAMHGNGKKDVALDVLQEIQQLIQDRIGSSLAPPPPAEPEALTEADQPPAGGAPAGGEEALAPEDADALASFYESEGVEEEEDKLKAKGGY